MKHEFKVGNTYGRGRPKKLKTVVKDWIKAHPMAIAALKDKLYQMGIDGDREAAIYMVDRFEGKPKASTELTGADGEALGAGVVVKLFQMMDERAKQLKGGNDADREGQKRLPEGIHETQEV